MKRGVLEGHGTGARSRDRLRSFPRAGTGARRR